MADEARPTRERMTQAERRRRTRDALVLAALEAFARDGFHAANLDAIAAAAGYSKGAIYAHFAGKAELFLAVIDYNLGALRGGDWDPLASPGRDPAPGRGGAGAPEGEAAVLVRGFALATLEFIATAARDDALADALRQRQQTMVDGYRRVVEAARPTDDALPAGDVALLMTALDQGATVLTTLGGALAVDGALLRRGMHRLVDLAVEGEPPVDVRDEPHPDVARVDRLLREDRAT